MTFESNINWNERKRVVLEVQAEGGTAADAAERLGMKTDTLLRSSRQLGLRFPPRHSHGPIDWNERQRVIIEVQKSGGTAKEAAERLGIKVDTVLKTSRTLGIRFPSNNGYHGTGKRATAVSKNAGTVAVAAQNKSAWTAYHARRRFAKAMEEAPPQSVSDAELIEKAIAQGKLTKVPEGSALIPLWISGAVDNCVKPRAGAKRGARA